MPRTSLLILVLAAMLLSAVAFARTDSSTISVEAIRPGMKGYGLTVFRGTRPERFDVEVIDVLHNFRPDQDLILVRTDHEVLRRAKVVAGMSGSPIYLDGKLAGAYAYGWPFGNEPVAGVTPIASMLAEINRPVNPEIWKALGTLPGTVSRADPVRLHPAGLPPYLGSERPDALRDLRLHASHLGYDQPLDNASPRPVPAATPVMLGGLTDEVVDLLNQELGRFGLVGLQAGGASGSNPKKPRTRGGPAYQGGEGYVNGGAIGVQLIRGDVSATAIGTITHVQKQRLVAFGHPMMNAGQTALPTSTAKVLHVLSSDQRSFKLAEALRPLGTLVHDRQSAIVVDKTLKADTVPVTLRIKGAEGAPRTEWRVEVASQRMLTPVLTFATMVNALRASVADRSDVTFKARSRVEIAGHGTVEVVDEGYSPIGLGHPMSLSKLRLFGILSAAYGNPFEDVRVLGVEVDLELSFQHSTLTILDAQVSSREVDPDSDVNVYLTLQRYGGQQQVRVVPVHVPQTAAGSKIQIELAPGNMVKLEQPKPKDLDQLLDIARAGYPSTSLLISTKLPSRGLRLRGHVVRGLPGSALDTLQLQNSTDRAQSFNTYTRSELPLGQVLAGSARITLDVREEPRR